MASPIISAVLSSMSAQSRTCAKCGHVQAISLWAEQQTVTCRRCGSAIAPQQNPKGDAPPGSSGAKGK